MSQPPVPRDKPRRSCDLRRGHRYLVGDVRRERRENVRTFDDGIRETAKGVDDLELRFRQR